MPYQTVSDTHGIYQRFSDVVTAPELLKSVTEVYRAQRFESIQYVIADFLDVQTFDVSMKTVMDVHVRNIGAHRSNPQMVVGVVTTDPRIIAAAQLGMSPALASYPMKTFSTVAAACEWIASRNTSCPECY